MFHYKYLCSYIYDISHYNFFHISLRSNEALSNGINASKKHTNNIYLTQFHLQ